MLSKSASHIYLIILTICLALFTSLSPAQVLNQAHGFALHGDLKYPENFEHFGFVNPEAPKGGNIRLMGFGTFDTLNPYTLKGISPFNSPGQFIYGFSELNETLLAGSGSYAPSGDEPQSAYGLLAESITYPNDIAWAEFKIRQNAFFHDKHPVDAEDVVFSYETLKTKGHPRFLQQLLNIKSVVATASHTVRVEFKEAKQRASILRFGELPVLPKHFWENKDFEKSSELIPLLSGPYEIQKVDLGKRVVLKRKADFWGKTLNIYRGRYNFDIVSIDYFRDQTVAFEAFKSDEFDLYFDYTAKNWASAYDFPALNKGLVIKEEIPHSIPSGTQGFFFNTRKDIFKDVRVRQAVGLAFDFEWTNKSLFNGAYRRNQSYYPNSDFSATGLPTKDELTLLEPHKQQLPNALFTQAFSLPKSKGNGKLRKQLRTATKLLKEAGWNIQNGKLIHQETGQVFEFELLVRSAGIQRVVLPFMKNLEKLGIFATTRLLDAAQYKSRLDNFEFDMTTFVLSQGMAPSFEQRDYFHSSTRDVKGSLNLAGIDSPVIDTLLEHVVSAESRPELITAMRALDRVLLWHHYAIPNWHLDYHRLAYWDRFERPSNQPPYKLGTENWWARALKK